MYTRLAENTKLLDHGYDLFRFLKDLTNTITTKSTSLLSCKGSTPGSIAATFESTSDQTSRPSQDSLNLPQKNLLLSMLQDKKNGKWRKFAKIESISRNANSSSTRKAMTKSKQLGNLSMPLKEPVPPSEPTGLKPITKLSPYTSLGHITKFGQLGQFNNQNTCLYPQNLTLTDFGHLSKTLTTLKPKPVILSPPLTNLRWKPNGIHVFCFISFLLGGHQQKSVFASGAPGASDARGARDANRSSGW